MNFDINVWDRIGYETSYKSEGWSLAAYTFDHQHFVASIDLLPAEWQQLTLGENVWYASDSDFWLDADTFMNTYPVIPARVRAFITGLFEEDRRKNDALLSVWQEVSTRDVY
jgi:hypothetical protein